MVSYLRHRFVGNTPTFGTSPGSGSVTDDTVVGTLLATISATDLDALDTLSVQWTGTTPAGNAGVFSYNNNTGIPRLYHRTDRPLKFKRSAKKEHNLPKIINPSIITVEKVPKSKILPISRFLAI